VAKVEERLKELGIVLGAVPTPVGSYKPAVVSGSHIYVSGQLPIVEGRLAVSGRLGEDLALEEGIGAARIAAINTVAVLKKYISDLDRVRRIVKVTGYVASARGFHMQAQVVNGASDLYYEVFGERGRHARAAVGVSELPLGAPVEIELIAEFAL
jgi:enamine deaminase RidA (YjgF/YER057c/UK114 family)